VLDPRGIDNFSKRRSSGFTYAQSSRIAAAPGRQCLRVAASYCKPWKNIAFFRVTPEPSWRCVAPTLITGTVRANLLTELSTRVDGAPTAEKRKTWRAILQASLMIQKPTTCDVTQSADGGELSAE
jgi:hypothetical protein